MIPLTKSSKTCKIKWYVVYEYSQMRQNYKEKQGKEYIRARLMVTGRAGVKGVEKGPQGTSNVMGLSFL